MEVQFVINCLETNNLDLVDIDPMAMCRTCLGSDPKDFRSVFSSTGVLKKDSGMIYSISEVIEELTNRTVRQDDGLPEQICRSCVKQLYSAFNLIKSTKKIDLAFRKYLLATNHPSTAPVVELPVSVERPASPYIEKEATEDYEEHVDIVYSIRTDDEQMIVLEPDEMPIDVENGVLAEDVKRMPVPVIPREQKTTIVKSSSGLKSEVKTEKDAPATHQCQSCDKTYNFKQSLMRHFKSAHTMHKLKDCSFCDRKFARADDLKRHIRTHTNERPYACEYCSKSFKQSSELKAHTLSHTKDTIFKCGVCQKEVTTRMGLYSHMKSHDDQRLSKKKEPTPKQQTIKNVRAKRPKKI